MDFAGAPRLVGRRIGDLELLSHALLAHRVDVVDPDRHPRALVRSLVDSRAAGLGVRAGPPLP
jgi:hypothetical protein